MHYIQQAVLLGILLDQSLQSYVSKSFIWKFDAPLQNLLEILQTPAACFAVPDISYGLFWERTIRSPSIVWHDQITSFVFQ